MTEALFEDYVSAMPKLRAERQMDAAEVAVYPHLTREASHRVWQRWQRAATRAVARVLREGFSWNGARVNLRGLRAHARQHFGGGYQEDRG